MKYWPASSLLQSPQLSRVQKREILRAAVQAIPVPWSTMAACRELVTALPACASLTFMCTEGHPYKLTYTARPTQESFMQLERSGFIAMGGEFGFTRERLY